MNIRHAELSDLPRMLEIFALARARMAANGNPTQWGTTNPPESVIREDIRLGRSYVLEQDGIVHGTFVFFIGDEPNYHRIDDGAWLNDAPYAVVHRVASDGMIHGFLAACMSWCLPQTQNLRIDTHRNNLIMQHLLEKQGFTRCGIVYMRDGSERIAYHLVQG